MAETTALATIETITAVDLFKPEVIDPILATIREQVITQAATLDISTPGNRSALAALAYKVGRSKTFIDGQRKSLVSDEKKRLAKIDAEGKRIWETLEALQHEVRKPLTDWEDAEKQRVADHEAALLSIQTMAGHCYPATSDQIQETIDAVKKYQGTDWEEFHKRASDTINASLHSLYNNHVDALKREEEVAELARLRSESAAREQKEREERIAREATEKAERESKEREETAAQATRDAESRAQAAEDQRVESERQAAQRATEAAERAERDKAEAVEAEKRRQANVKSKEEAETKAREKDKTHKADIHNAALVALVAVGLSEADAKKVVTAIAQGKIPAVKVVY